MYATIYGYNIDSNGRRETLGNVTDIELNDSYRTYDFSQTTVQGACDFEMKRPLLYVIKDERGKQISAGFVKSPRVEDGVASFTGDDLKKILSTDIILDFTQEPNPSHALVDIFNKVNSRISSAADPSIYTVDFEFTVPADTTNTKVIADYTGQYIVVEALKFLKVYLSYFKYYIKPTYDEAQDVIRFEYVKQNDERIEIKLKDFIHEKTGQDIKVNKAIATVSFDPSTEESNPLWESSDVNYWNSQPESNRDTIIAAEPPSPDGYPLGFALKLLNGVAGLEWITSSYAEYNSATNKTGRTTPSNTDTCPLYAPSFAEAIAAAGDANDYTPGTIVKVTFFTNNFAICYDNQHSLFIKADASGDASYHKITGVDYRARPNMPEKIYTLGNDNEIYDGYAPSDKRIYPIITKVHEAQFLSEAQINAVSALVNSRYIENIIITETNQINPIELGGLDLNTMVRVYDQAGEYKDIPISEKTRTVKKNESSFKIKLGFKKTLLTEIIKTDVQDDSVVKTGTSRGGTIINKTTGVGLADPTNEPDPNEYPIWYEIDTN